MLDTRKKAHTVNIQETTQALLSEKISEAMDDKGVSIRDLALRLGLTYEHARRLVRGEAIPSNLVLRAMCDELGMNFKEAEALATASKIRKKYGTIPMELAGKNPELEPIERSWPYLTEQQKQDATTMITGWAKRNKALRV